MEQAILNAEEKVFIEGDVFINKTIEIRNKNLSIVGLNTTVHWRKELSGKYQHKDFSARFAFTVPEDETIVIKDVHFRGKLLHQNVKFSLFLEYIKITFRCNFLSL